MWRGPKENVNDDFDLASPARLVRLTWMVLETGWCWRYNYCFVGWCFQDWFNTTRKILAQLSSSFFSIRFINVYVVYPYNRIDSIAVWKKSRFILSDWFVLHMVDNRSIADHAFARCILKTCSVDETQLPRYADLSTNFRELPFRVCYILT